MRGKIRAPSLASVLAMEVPLLDCSVARVVMSDAMSGYYVADVMAQHVAGPGGWVENEVGMIRQSGIQADKQVAFAA